MQHEESRSYLGHAFAARGQGRLGRLLLPCNPKLPCFPGRACRDSSCCCNCRLLLLNLRATWNQLCRHPLLLLLMLLLLLEEWRRKAGWL